MDTVAFKGAILTLVAIVIGVLVLAFALDEPNIASISNTATTTTTTATVTQTTVTTTASPVRAPQAVKVVVANGTEADGAAGSKTAVLVNLGYDTLSARDIVSSQKPLQSSNIYYLPGWEAEAKAVGRALGISESELDFEVAPLPLAFNTVEIGDAVVIVLIGTSGALTPEPAS